MHAVSASDRDFVRDLERGAIGPGDFNHRAHVRAAYIYLAMSETDGAAVEGMRAGLTAFLQQHGIDASKYHETLTRAWVLAVRHFMQRTPSAASADEFIAANPELLDSRIMLTHYSADVLFSAEARQRFVLPDLDPIPAHAR